MKRWTWVFVGAAAVAMGVAVAVGFPKLGPGAGDYDMIRTLREIEQVNADIGAANASILAVLGGVRQQSSRMERVHGHLVRLETLLGAQRAELDGLIGVTAGQAEMSRDLATLTAEIRPAMTGMARTAAMEADALTRMGASTDQLAGRLRQVEEVNRTVQGKLGRAEELSALILKRMP